MTIQNNPTRNQYTATGGQTVFNYNFEIISTGDISVFKGDTRLAISTDYTLTGVGNESGGTVTLVVGATTGDIITIYRSTVPERLTDYQNSGDFLADEVNSDFDRLWAVTQEQSTSSDFFLQLKQSTVLALPFELDEPVASNILRYKADLTGIENVPLSSIPDASTAADLAYDNATSSLTATDVQAAIDEVVVDSALKADLTGAAFAGAVSVAGALSSTAGNVNLKSNTALSDAAATLTAAQLIGGEFTITPTVARIQTTDTAANIIAALTGSVDNSNFETTIVNLAAFDVTLAAGTGVTLVGNMTVNNGSATFRVRRLTSSTVSITRLETGSGPLIYTSPDQTITVGGTLTLTHGLGVRPTDIKAQLICAVANNNYPIGAVLPISTGYQGDNFDNNRTMSVWTENDTEIDISFGSTSNTFIIIHATSGARVLITNTDWRLRIIAKEY